MENNTNTTNTEEVKDNSKADTEVNAPVQTSDNGTANNNTGTAAKSSKSKSGIYIGAFSLVVVVLLFFAFVIGNNSGDTKNTGNSRPAANGNGGRDIQKAQSVHPDVAGYPEITKGSTEKTIDADIKIPDREIDFKNSLDDVIKYEDGKEDTLDSTTAQGTDGYKYVTFQSNPDKPVKLFNVPFTSESLGISYVFHNDSFEEVRFQFGFIDEASTQTIVAGFAADYGEATFFRSTSDSQTWMWKSSTIWLMVSKDSAGTTVFYRKL